MCNNNIKILLGKNWFQICIFLANMAALMSNFHDFDEDLVSWKFVQGMFFVLVFHCKNSFYSRQSDSEKTLEDFFFWWPLIAFAAPQCTALSKVDTNAEHERRFFSPFSSVRSSSGKRAAHVIISEDTFTLATSQCCFLQQTLCLVSHTAVFLLNELYRKFPIWPIWPIAVRP